MKEQGTIRLADRILARTNWAFLDESFIKTGDGQERFRRWIRETLELAPIFDANNVADYAREHGKEFYKWSELPLQIPPFRKAWFEFCLTDGIKCGVLCTHDTFENSCDARASLIRMCKTTSLPPTGDDFVHRIDLYPILDFRPIRNKWKLIGPDADGVMPFGFVSMLVDKLGNIASESPQSVLPFWVDSEDEKRKMARMMGPMILAAQLSMSFANCKNVKTVTNEPPVKLSKAFQRRHGRPLVRYHTLEIEPMKQVLETEGDIGHNGLKKALHICRGHFATYTPEKPLFGRVTGTVWKPAHVRGDSALGIVKKDYRVNAPQGGAV